MTPDAFSTARLLVPLDGSDLAEQALAYALALQATETETVLAHVLPEPEPRYDESGTMRAPVESVLDTQLRAAERALEEVASTWGLARERVHVAVRVGDPAENVLDVAETQRCTLVVLASHGRGAVGRWRFGSVADRLARSAPIPVLIVRPDPTAAEAGTARSIERLLVPLDGSPRAERALPVAGALARQLHLPVRLARVVPSRRMAGAVGAAAFGAPASPLSLREQEDVMAREFQAARRYLDQVARHDALRSCTTETDVLAGDPAATLLELAQQTDLVVLTSRGRGGVARWLLGSVADKVVRGSAAPVCLVPDVLSPARDREAEEVSTESVWELLLREVYSPREAAKLVGTDVASICQAAYRGDLPAKIVNHDVVSIRRQDLAAWMRRR